MDSGDPIREAADREDFGRVIRLGRQARGLTQRQLGEACGYSQPAISRIERGGSAAHDVRTLRRIAEVLNISPALLGLAAAPPDESAESVNRREFLAGATAVAVAGSSTPGAVPNEAVPYFTAQLAAHWRADRVLGPHLLIETVVPQCRTLLRAIGATKGALHRDLLQLATAYTGLAAWLHQDAGDLDTCSYWLGETLELAHRARDPQLIAYALTCKAMVRADAGDGMGAVDLAEAALGTSAKLCDKARVMAMQQAAYGRALIGDRGGVDRLLSDMATVLERMDDNHLWGGDRLYRTPADIIDVQRATCYGRLGAVTDAVELWERATERPSAEHRDAGVHLARYATALVQADATNKAADRAATAARYLHETRSARMRREFDHLTTAAAQVSNPNSDLADVLATT